MGHTRKSVLFKTVRGILGIGRRARDEGEPFHQLARTPRPRMVLTADPGCIYAIGDIHGCFDKLERLLRAISEDARRLTESKLLVFLGDYIDRGPNSAAVIDYLMAPPMAGFQRVWVCGNHEEMLLDALEGTGSLLEWLELGGHETLLSYGYDIRPKAKKRSIDEQVLVREILEVIPEHHLGFLRKLPVSFATPSYLFVHAGIRPGVPLAEQSEHDMVWIRNAFLDGPDPEIGKLVVHGHTPRPRAEATPWHVNVDTGAYRGGPLTAARLTNGCVDFIGSE